MNIDIARYHEKAIKIARREDLTTRKQRIVAFVLDSKGRLLTTGWNSYIKTHPEQKKAAAIFSDRHKQYMHAEVHALTRLSYKQLGKQKYIIVIRLGIDDRMLPSCPCRICKDVIKRKYDIGITIHS